MVAMSKVLIFMFWNVVYFSYLSLSMSVGLLCLLSSIWDDKIEFLDPKKPGTHIKFVEFGFK